MKWSKREVIDGLKTMFIIFIILVVIGWLSDASALTIDADNTTAGENYIKWCFKEGTPPYNLTFDTGWEPRLWPYDCIVETGLEPDTLYSVAVVDAADETTFDYYTTQADIFTSDLAWYIYATVVFIVLSLVFPPFVYLSWITGTIAVADVIVGGHDWLFIFLVGFLFVCGFLRLAIAYRRMNG